MIKGESLKSPVSVIAPGCTHGDDRDVRRAIRGGKTALKLVPGFFFGKVRWFVCSSVSTYIHMIMRVLLIPYRLMPALYSSPAQSFSFGLARSWGFMQDGLVAFFLDEPIHQMSGIVRPAGCEHNPTRFFVHARQKQKHEEEVGKVVDGEVRLEAIVCKCLAFHVLQSGIEKRSADGRDPAGVDPVIDVLG